MADEVVPERVDDGSSKKGAERRRELREELAKAHQRIKELEQTVQRLQGDVENSTRQRGVLDTNLKAHSERSKKVTRDLDASQKEVHVVRRRLEVAQRDLAAKDAVIAELEQQIATLTDKVLVANRPHPPRPPIAAGTRVARVRRSQRP